MAATLDAMARVAAQPSAHNPGGNLNEPITVARIDRCIRAIISGTAITPFNTALQ